MGEIERARSLRGVYDDEEEEPFCHGRLEGGPFNGAKNGPPRLCDLSPRPPAIGPFNCAHPAPLSYRARFTPYSPPFFDWLLAFPAPPSLRRVYLALASFILQALLPSRRLNRARKDIVMLQSLRVSIVIILFIIINVYFVISLLDIFLTSFIKLL